MNMPSVIRGLSVSRDLWYKYRGRAVAIATAVSYSLLGKRRQTVHLAKKDEANGHL